VRKPIKQVLPYSDNVEMIIYADGTKGLRSKGSNEPLVPMDLSNDMRSPGLSKPIPYYRTYEEAAKEHGPMLKIGEHISKEDALRFARESEKMSDEYRKTLIKEIESGYVSAVNFGFDVDEDSEKIEDSKKGGDF
jgi:hypothetical protein